jgi:7-cyano-7-deazaguanine synthase in queuosine biosynthesis
MQENNLDSENYWHDQLLHHGERYWENCAGIKQILLHNRGYVIEPPQNETVILLFSGGMDSTLLIDVLIRRWNCKVILLYFRRDAKNQHWEESSIDFFWNFFKTRWKDNLLELIKIDLQIPLRLNKNFLDRSRQKYFGLPLRNAVMWDNAFAQAVYLSGKYQTTIRSIIVGSVGEDETSPESGILAILGHTLSVCISLGLWYYQLVAPYLDGSLEKKYSKIDLIQYAKKYDIPLENTRSCFESTENPCGICLACKNRLNAYEDYKKCCE